MVQPLADAAGLELRVLAEEAVLTEADPSKLREVIINLLHNAIEYNKPNGAIELAVGRTGSQLEITVSDTGIGIAPEARARIFERFFRADPSRHADTPHCGLGLAIVKSYVDLMGGSISVDSGEWGTAFRVLLPIVEIEKGLGDENEVWDEALTR